MSNASFLFVQALAKELSDGIVDLPGFPRVFSLVCRALDDPNNSSEQMALIVGAEPSLAARLLLLSNSVTFTHVGKPISDLRLATIRLGTSNIRAAASAFAVEQVKRQASLRPVLKELEHLWKRSTRLAALCHVLGRHAKLNPDEAALAGLLHGMGSLYLLVRAVSQPAPQLAGDELEALTSEWNASITKAILENWSFPEHIVTAAADQDDWDRRHFGTADVADVLISAKSLLACANDRQCLERRFGEVAAIAKLALTVDQYLELVQEARAQMAAIQKALTV